MELNYKKIILFFIVFCSTFVLGACNIHKTRSWTWYEIVGNSVYFNYEDKDGQKDRTAISAADVRSFQILSDNYAKDKKNVYFWDKILGKADAQTFQVINDGYAKDHNLVFRLGEEIREADPESFEVLQHIYMGYAKDKKSAYFNGVKVQNADPGTFQYLMEWWAKDKNNVYYQGKLVDGGDPVSFEPLDTFYGKDKNAVYAYFDGTKIDLPHLDPATFEIINGYYVKDKDHVFFGIASTLASGEKMLLMDADPATFEVSCEGSYLDRYCQYGKDKNGLYYQGQKDDLCPLIDTVELEKITGMVVLRSKRNEISSFQECVVGLKVGSITLTKDFRTFAEVREIAGQYDSLGGKKLSMEDDVGVGDMSALRFLDGIPDELLFSKNGQTFTLSGARYKDSFKREELIQIGQGIVKRLSAKND